MADPLEGKTLEYILTKLIDHYGFEEMSRHININCFSNDPSIKSSLKFLRRMPWARSKVEAFYIRNIKDLE